MIRMTGPTACLCLMIVSRLLMGLSCYAQDTVSRPAIEYAYPDQSVWTTKTDSAGVLRNPLLNLAEALFTSLNYQWTANPYPANRMFERLEEGKSNFSMLVRAPRLEKSCIFSKYPIVTTELRVYRTAESLPITRKEDLRGKQIITIRGYSYGAIGRYLRNTNNDVVIFDASRHESAFEMLAYGRAEYLLDYTGPSEEILAAKPIAGITSDILQHLGVYFVLARSYPNAPEVMATFERAAASIDVSQWGLTRP